MVENKRGLKDGISWNVFPKNKRGQLTIFIIIAVVVVVIGVLIYMFYPQIRQGLGLEETNPQEFIQTCIEEEIKTDVEMLSAQGGSLDPQHYIMYDNSKVEYLCYTNEFYVPCVVQQPMLKNHVEEEIKADIRNKVDACFESMRESFQKKGYTVNLVKGEQDLELLPKRIVATFGHELTLTKGETEQYDSFVVVLNNNLYELISIANSIIESEATYGDAETTAYMGYYHDLKVEKKKQSDGSTVYILTDRNTGNKFQFASRSVAWPPGYGF